ARIPLGGGRVAGLPPSMTDIEMVRASVVGDHVGAGRELDGVHDLERTPVDDLERAVPRAAHEKLLRRGDVEGALWLSEPAEAMDDAALPEVDHLHGVAVARGDEEPLPLEIHRGVVEAAGDV